ncbi:hypothetical protein [Microbacterium esteraromaticum]|uniref:hypothetical protein n=1 Tax=Microbacterium esteraromaticum TaxID=57043 RepID=UPI0015F5218B|nr:hypothetical protein [Microbacterium esteraromaticum]
MTYYTLAGLLMLAGALVGFVDVIRPHLHTQSTSTAKTADQTGRRFTHPEVLDERKTTR